MKGKTAKRKEQATGDPIGRFHGSGRQATDMCVDKKEPKIRSQTLDLPGIASWRRKKGHAEDSGGYPYSARKK